MCAAIMTVPRHPFADKEIPLNNSFTLTHTHTHYSKIEKNCDIHPSRRYVLIREMIPSIRVAASRSKEWGKRQIREGEKRTVEP